ncbi:MAG: sensor histidine kinase [Streptosporangiaceae bacterium]
MAVSSALPAGAALVALFTVAVHRRSTVAAPVAVLHILAQLPYNLLYPDPTTPYWGAVGFGALGIAAITAWGMTVRARRQLVLSLRDRAHRAEAEQQLRAEQARRAERARIAREMHDVLAHRISLLSTYAGALEYRRDASAEDVARAAGVMRVSAHQALQDLREVIGVLREDANDLAAGTSGTLHDADAPERPQPTIADLPGLVEESRHAGMRLAWRSQPDLIERIPERVGRNAYRIVQEGLTNVRKHAPDTATTVTVDGAPGEGSTVEVRNRLPVGGEQGPGIPGAGSGLLGLAERANLAGGRLEHGITTDGDFRLRAWLPWPA